MRSDLRTVLAALATSAVLLGSATMALASEVDPTDPDPAGTATASPSTPEPSETTPTPTPRPSETIDPPSTTTRTITDAQLRWGVNNETNNRAFAPGTFNFMSAGKIPDPGKGGVIMPQSSWRQVDGNVSIEKYLRGAWTPATWAGLRTTSAGSTMTGSNGPFSDHEVVVDGGTGTVDPADRSAAIQWTGSFTVIYYSGYSFFYVTDPKLTVTDGVGTLTGTLSGYRSSMEDMDTWEAVPPVPGVVLATLGKVDLSADLGFSVKPAYAGVAVSVPADQVPQVRNSSVWGAFPQSFVDYQLTSGAGAYWYSSGGAADAHKPALPVTVSYSTAAPLKVKPATARIVKKSPAPDNDARDAPDGSDGPGTRPLASAGQPPAPPLPLTAPVAGDAVLAGVIQPRLTPVSTISGVRSRPLPSGAPTGVWVLGGVLLVAAAALALGPFAYAAKRRNGRPSAAPGIH
jgi:hypothetical protein